MGAILIPVAPLQHNDSWASAFGSPDLMDTETWGAALKNKNKIMTENAFIKIAMLRVVRSAQARTLPTCPIRHSQHTHRQPF